MVHFLIVKSDFIPIRFVGPHSTFVEAIGIAKM